MTTKQDIETSLITYILAGYNTAFPAVPIAWGNQPFDYNTVPDVYVQATVRLDSTEGLAVNSPLDRHNGNLHFVVITKPGLGTLTANQVCDYLYKAYRHQSVDGIEIRDAKMAGEGAAHDGYEIKLVVPFITPPL
jgi:hypothetical protein